MSREIFRARLRYGIKWLERAIYVLAIYAGLFAFLYLFPTFFHANDPNWMAERTFNTTFIRMAERTFNTTFITGGLVAALLIILLTWIYFDSLKFSRQYREALIREEIDKVLEKIAEEERLRKDGQRTQE